MSNKEADLQKVLALKEGEHVEIARSEYSYSEVWYLREHFVLFEVPLNGKRTYFVSASRDVLKIIASAHCFSKD